MKKIIALKIVFAIIVAVTIVAFSVLFVTPQTWLFKHLYEQRDMESQIGMSDFEANLNYDTIVEQIMGRQPVQGMATYASSMEMQLRIVQLRKVYTSCRYICGFGMIIVIGGIILLRDKKWYHCLNFGGLGAILVFILSSGLAFVIRPLREFVFKSQYSELFANDPMFVGILPEGIMLYYWLAAMIFVFVLGLVFALIHLEERTDYTPHEF